MTTRLALDRFRTLARRREDYVGPWLPEPVALVADDPAVATEQAESLTLGFLVVLDALSATEQAVFLLADVFGEPYSTIAAAVGKTEENCRQIASRARRKVRSARPPEVAPAGPEVLAALLAATASGDIEAVLELLDTDVVLVSDGGPDRRAARRPVVGAPWVARLLRNLAARATDVELEVDVGSVNGETVAVFRLADGPQVVDADLLDGRVVALRILRNPAKLTHLAETVDLR